MVVIHILYFLVFGHSKILKALFYPKLPFFENCEKNETPYRVFESIKFCFFFYPVGFSGLKINKIPVTLTHIMVCKCPQKCKRSERKTHYACKVIKMDVWVV